MDVIFNTNEARAFSDWLDTRAVQLASAKKKYNDQFVAASATWKDERYDKYMVVMTETLLAINSVLLASRQYTDYLRKRSERVDIYLRRYGKG